ncbi:MAG: HTTM domain-containing protein [Vulcanimicrobiota bacterium]
MTPDPPATICCCGQELAREARPDRGPNPFALDPRSIAVWRAGLGFMVCLDVILRLRDLTVFYTDAGVLPRALLLAQPWAVPRYNLFLAAGSALGQAILFALTAAAATALALGYHPRWAGLATWFMVCSLQLRNPLVLDGGDELLRVMLFWTMFLPVEARFSTEPQPPRRGLYLGWASFGYVLQVILLYLFAALNKSGDVWRKTGEALYYTLSIEQFTTRFGLWLLGYPGVLKALTFAVLALEFTLPVLLLLPFWVKTWRTIFLGLALCFHLGIAATLHLGLFMPIALVSLLALIPSNWWPEPLEPEQDYPNPPVGLQAFLALTCAYLVAINLWMLDPSHSRAPTVMRWFGLLTCEQQVWRLFGPEPFREDGWFVVEAVDANGQAWDLTRTPRPLDLSKPANMAGQFPNQRWRRWLQNLAQDDFPELGVAYLDYRARHWDGSSELRSLRLIFMEEPTPEPGQAATVRQRVLAQEKRSGPVRLRF